MKQILILSSILAIASCKDQTSTTAESTSTIKTEDITSEEDLNSKQKIAIDFASHKDLLDIILLLPEKAFLSWDWKLEERMKWYNEIKSNNYYIDDNPDFFTQQYFEPSQAGFTIVDGFWSIHLYKTSENTYIVVTADLVGDENTLNFYEVKSNTIKEYLSEKLMFPNYKALLMKKGIEENCDETFNELNNQTFEYNFSPKNKIEIECSWSLTEDAYSNCLIGNAILYNFKPQSKQFEMEKIYWKPKKSN